MPHIISGSGVHWDHADFGQATDVDGGELITTGVLMGALTVENGGTARLAGTTASAVFVETEGSLYADDLNTGVIDATGARTIAVDGAEVPQLAVDDTDETLELLEARGLRMGNPEAMGEGNQILLTAVTRATIEASCYRARETAVVMTDCRGIDADLKVVGAGSQTNNTYPAVELAGTTADINLRGSVRGGAGYGNADNAPSYAVEVGAACTAIDLWLAITGMATGDVDDNTTGEVTVH